MALVLGHWQLRGFGLWAVEERGDRAHWPAGSAAGSRKGGPAWKSAGRFRREFWGRGYATEAAQTVLADAFSRPRTSAIDQPDPSPE